MTTLAAVRRAALRSLIPPPRLALSDWIERELRLPADTTMRWQGAGSSGTASTTAGKGRRRGFEPNAVSPLGGAL